MKLKKYLHVTPTFYSIGNAAEEILWAYKRAEIEGLKVNIIAPYSWTEFLNYRICNRELFRLVCDSGGGEDAVSVLYLIIVRFIVNMGFIVKRGFSLVGRKYIGFLFPEKWHFPQVGMNKYWPVYDDISGNISSIINDPIIAQMHKPFSVGLRKKTKNICADRLSAFGIPRDAKYICLHVRDAGFHADNSRRSYRNADIASYRKGIEYLLNRGLYVFRMGDAKMKKINFTHDKLIDYPFTSIKSEEMDLFLISNCEFYIGMQSGVYSVALLFDKPVLLLNMVDWFYPYPLKIFDRGLLKKIKIKGSGLFLTMQDRFSLPFFYTDVRSKFSDEIEFFDNNPEEILMAIMGFYDDYITGKLSNKMIESNKNYSMYMEFVSSVLLNSPPEKMSTYFTNSTQALSRFSLYVLASRGSVYDFN